MYISSNWILAKALRTVLSMVRELRGAGLSQAGVIPATVKKAELTLFLFIFRVKPLEDFYALRGSKGRTIT